jgi:chemotaxis protein CheC
MKYSETEKNKKMTIFRELLSSATNDVSVAMSRWTDGLVTMTFDDVQDFHVDEVIDKLVDQDSLLNMVILSLEGKLGGEMILAFDDRNGRELAKTLLRREVTRKEDEELAPIEVSALTETGNILGCAYLGAITRLIQRDLIPSIPFFVRDLGSSVLEQSLAKQAKLSDEILVCRTVFHRADTDLSWHVFFFPSEELQEVIQKSLIHQACPCGNI